MQQMQDLFSVKDKVVVVTGGSRGIGEMIAAGYLANGAKVYITSRKAAVCDATAARLGQGYARPRSRQGPRAVGRRTVGRTAADGRGGQVQRQV